MERRRDPREPTPLVLMNPELRVRQLRYAANIEATQMVPLHRYYEVLLDLSTMGLEYLKALKLERAFIIFKRIEYFIFHRLKDHPGIQSFSSEAKSKIMGRLPMIMYVAQQIIVDFILPVYERQAAYFRYEELQRRLRILNPVAWNAIMNEAAKRELEFYNEAETISTRFGVELSSFLPYEITPDDHHPSNFPPRTFPAIRAQRFLSSQRSVEDLAAQAALTIAINSMNSRAESITVSGDQPIETFVQNINEMMNTALTNFFNTRNAQANSQPNSIPFAVTAELSSSQLAEINYQTTSVNLVMPQSDPVERRNSSSPRVDHMYCMPNVLPGSSHDVRETNKDRIANDYNSTPSVDTYISLLTSTFEANSGSVTGFRIHQVAHGHAPSPSTAGFMLHLERDYHTCRAEAETKNEASFPQFTFVPPLPVVQATRPVIFPEPDPGPPGKHPPTEPVVSEQRETKTWGVWAKRGAAYGPDGMGSLGVLSDLDRAREVLDSVPPMPQTASASNSERNDVNDTHVEERVVFREPYPIPLNSRKRSFGDTDEKTNNNFKKNG